METVIVDQSDWGLVRVTGADRVRFVQGMVIGDVAALATGDWLRTAMLSPKGRVTTIFDIVAEDDAFVIIDAPGQDSAALLSKYAIMDDVEFAPLERDVHRVWTDPAAVWTAPPIWQKPDSPSSVDAIECRRIEAGLPRIGADIGEKSFPFESPLADLINYEKGCYIGQEPVHRVHAKGQAQKLLRGLRFDGEGPIAVGAAVSHPERENLGAVSSSVVSPDFGPIALATLHRTAFEPGQTVTCEGRQAVISALPFSG